MVLNHVSWDILFQHQKSLQSYQEIYSIMFSSPIFADTELILS